MSDRDTDFARTTVLDTDQAVSDGSLGESWIARMAPALRHSRFTWLWASSFLSNVGTWMQSLAQGWLVFQLTHSPFWLGAVAFAFSVPGLLMALVGGVIADNRSTRLILIATQSVMMLSAFAMSVLVFLKMITIPEILALTALSGIATAINIPAYHSLIPNLVPRNELTNAVALNSAQFHTSRIVGPALAGFAIAFFGTEGNFFINGISFVAPILVLTRMGDIRACTPQPGNFWFKLKGGFAYLFDREGLPPLLALIMLGSFLALPYMAFIPYFARDILRSNERGLGTLMACSGAGSLLGAGTVAYLNMVRGRSMFLFGAGLAFFSMIIFFCFSRSFLFSSILLMGVGYASVLMGATANAIVQHAVAEHVRGRVISIYFTAVTGLPPIGGLLAGSLSRVFPMSYILAAMAVLAFAGSLVIFAGSKALRELD